MHFFRLYLACSSAKIWEKAVLLSLPNLLKKGRNMFNLYDPTHSLCCRVTGGEVIISVEYLEIQI